jgi:glutathione S-transferase
MITLYHAPQSRSSRIIWLLEEIGVPYKIRPVSIFRPLSGEGAPDPANPHPDRRVPAILHDDTLVAESVAIVLYLTDAFPEAKLGPAVGDAQRGAYLTWLAWYAAELEPCLLPALFGELANAPMMQRRWDAVIHRLQETLSRHPYVMGDNFTGADLLVASAIVFGSRVFPAGDPFDAYVARCKSRPAALRGIELDAASGLQNAA